MNPSSATWTFLSPSPCLWQIEGQLGKTRRSSDSRETSCRSDRSTSPSVCQPPSLVGDGMNDCMHRGIAGQDQVREKAKGENPRDECQGFDELGWQGERGRVWKVDRRRSV